MVEAFELSAEGGHPGLALLVQSGVVLQAFLGLVDLLERGCVAYIVLRVHHNGQFLVFGPQSLDLADKVVKMLQFSSKLLILLLGAIEVLMQLLNEG